jgi:hypothetical protein
MAQANKAFQEPDQKPCWQINEGNDMNAIKYTMLLAAVVTGQQLSITTAQAGAEHSVWPIVVDDYSDCTEEPVVWTAEVRQVFLHKVTPSGQTLTVDKWNFEGTVEGLNTGYVWNTKGVVNLRETYALDNSLTGGFGLLERAILHPVTPGAPRMRLDVHINFRFNAAGEMVVERTDYTYHCVGK